MIDDVPDASRARVREDFGVELATTEAVGHGADRLARLWRARAADGTRYAIADWSRLVLDVASAEADRRQALDIVRGLVSPHGVVTLASSAPGDLARPQ